LLTIGCEYDIKNVVFQKKLEELREQINTNKIFMNMVIHDMRNPTGSIEFGVQRSIDLLQMFAKKLKSLKKISQKFEESDSCQSGH
jgi:hypothetical protein